MEIHGALAVGVQDLLDVLDRQVGEVLVVLRRLDHDLVGADPVHLVVQPLAPPVERALDLERGELVGYHAHGPAGTVGRPAPGPIGEDLRRRAVLVAGAERAEMLLLLVGDRDEAGGPAAALGRDDDPAADDRILAQLGHEAPRESSTDAFRAALKSSGHGQSDQD